MKISELKQPYRDLAEMRREQHGVETIELIGEAFFWTDTPEQGGFWNDVYRGETPDIPSSSLAELEAWRKAKQEANKPETWGKQLYDSGQFHDLLTKYENAEPDYKELYEQRTAQFNELLTKYDNPTHSRNWVAECAINIMPSIMDLYSSGTGAETISCAAWNYAEAWAAEGKKRGHL